MHPDLIETLRQAQRFGFFGSGPIEQAVAHARAYVDAIGPLPPASRLVDLGSGGGLPGLVLADAFGGVEMMLIDRRQKRTDFLAQAVTRLGFDHVTVRCSDVRALCRDVRSGSVASFQVVTARGFGPPVDTLRLAQQLITVDGRVIISEPPTGDRWPHEVLVELGVCIERRRVVSVFERLHAPDE
jgi:16S rRNA (guanine527-N7)-methyltransferase